MGHLTPKSSEKHEVGSKRDNASYPGEADVDVQICSVLTGFGCKSGIEEEKKLDLT